MAGMSREEYDAATREILAAWQTAQTRDDGLRVIVDFGRKYGFKNVMAAIQGRTPKRFDREKTVEEWTEEQRRSEAGS